ncbi:metalloregulator ArsR/SmtB family transcription factor [Marivibrio halodurans]|uniref:Metalloregulator ArsR/SmtB family transcription factor n=1 Tax=Marivibrio halodurans TaxID=2039722 RepID=A0A8J7SBB5_9PROT|nr:metalloregulator ArsR/SmtB family transcription factor [Marivibrio halodurans]MBP5858877.1 metalloregulator ArsR/SmtB family transcription factor [Marivibrio halodurans]
MDELLQGLRAAAEPTRLRVLALCAHAELTVSELVRILGQSQPRVSRHLKLMVEAGLLERFQEGNWARYRLAGIGTPTLSDKNADRHAAVARFAEAVIDLLPADDRTLGRDLDRLQKIKAERDRAAQDYFARNAKRWDRIRALHVDEKEVNQALVRVFGADRGARSLGRFLDVGTGTGRILELLAPRAEAAVGVDSSSAMLSIARAAIDRAHLNHCQVRQGDMYQLPFADGAFDSVSVHMVLHYADEPARVLEEAARVLAPGGRLVVIDFEAHNLAELRAEHQHRWAGFEQEDVREWMRDVGFQVHPVETLEGGPLTVCLWVGERPAEANENALAAG